MSAKKTGFWFGLGLGGVGGWLLLDRLRRSLDLGERFDKRIYDVAMFRAALDDMFAHLDDMRVAARGGRLDRAFAERIMLALTQVCGCRYCSYAHSRTALEAGLSSAEVEAILCGEFAGAPREQLPALLFAQHYADTFGQPDPAARQRLLDTYGPAMGRDILAYLRMILLGNLLGNTLDAFLRRLFGRPVEESSLGQELGVLLGGLLWVPEGMLRRS
ncbi:MAG: carboxymuconolactone decarboxylase family protein [Chloroflexia bacterium]|nr:carboxymuconolactone decarboxylase family protein [Chloroflexia bacterium]